MSEDQEQSLLSSATDTETESNNNSPEQRPGDDTMSDGSENASWTLRKIAAVMGASGVIMGAFGAHALKETLTKKGTAEMWQTATNYQLFHSAAVLSLAAASAASASLSPSSMERKAIASNHLRAGKLMGLGNLLFSGSIYLLALDIGPKKILGPVTPLGGLLMIAGWVVIGMI